MNSSNLGHKQGIHIIINNEERYVSCKSNIPDRTTTNERIDSLIDCSTQIPQLMQINEEGEKRAQNLEEELNDLQDINSQFTRESKASDSSCYFLP